MRTGRGNLRNFLWFEVCIFVVMASDALMNLLTGLHSSRFGGGSYMIFCGDFVEVHIKSPSCSLQTLEKRQLYFSVIISEENGRKTGNVTY